MALRRNAVSVAIWSAAVWSAWSTGQTDFFGLTAVQPNAAHAQDAAAPKPQPPAGKPATAQPATAQPAAKQPAAKQPAAGKPPVEDFAKVFAEWQSVDKELGEIQERFGAAPATERETLRKRFGERVEQANALLPRLRDAAMAAYAAKPNADPEVTKTLLGLANNALASDDYRDALAIANLLIANKCPEKRLTAIAGMAAFNANDFDTAQKYLQQAFALGQLDEEGELYVKDIGKFQQAWKDEAALREKEAADDDLPRVKLTTNKGVIIIELFENQAPQAVGNFVSLVEKKYYDGLTFHRVLPGFMAQGGCPKGDGTGGPGYEIYCECERADYRHHFGGTLSMAHAGKDTGGSQFFLTFRPTPHLDGRHTAFGRVIEGMDVLVKLQRRDPNRSRTPADKILKAEVVRKRQHEYQPKKVGG
jgi:cyclophilin family peptidyl-prolyl cis-trans isomerase